MDPLSLETNQNVTSTWDVLRRLKLPRIRDMRRYKYSEHNGLLIYQLT